MKKLLFAALALCFFFAACNHGDDTVTPAAKTRKDTLATGMWRITSLTATGKWPLTNRDTTLDIFANFDSCSMDDRYIFRTDGKLLNDQGTVKCYPAGAQQMDGGTWTINSSYDTLEMDDATLPGRYKIASFGAGNMSLEKDSSVLIFPAKLRATLAQDQ